MKIQIEFYQRKFKQFYQIIILYKSLFLEINSLCWIYPNDEVNNL